MAELTVRGGRLAIGSSGMSLEWAVGEAPAPGQTQSGDRDLVAPTESGVLVVVLDALGHGPGASQVADIALEEFRSVASARLEAALLACHARLRETRGAVATLASFDRSGTLSWLGVGNVTGMLWRSSYGRLRIQAQARTSPGIIGLQMPSLRPDSHALRAGDILVMATDGIAIGSADRFNAGDTPEAVARRLVADHKVASDDGLVVVARYLTTPIE